MNSDILLLLVFAAATLLGYRLIRSVPSLLHTPLMSGMNALSGVTLLGALLAAAIAFSGTHPALAGAAGALAIIVAMINLVGGFCVTDRMLKMFSRKESHRE